MDPIVEELRVLQEKGIVVDEITYKFKVLIVTTNTVARPSPRNVVQYNCVSRFNTESTTQSGQNWGFWGFTIFGNG
jgi:hypothetical protein